MDRIKLVSLSPVGPRLCDIFACAMQVLFFMCGESMDVVPSESDPG